MGFEDDLQLPEGGFDGRCELMLGVTCDTLRSDPELRLCEGLRLIDATHRAVARMAPEALDLFERRVLPQLRSILMTRFGVTDLPPGGLN